MSNHNRISVIKRNGSKEELDLEKFHRVVQWACEGITGVSPSEIELRSQIQFYDGIKTSDIQEMIIKAAADLISEETPNYDKVAGNLINYTLRKEVYGRFEPSTLRQHYEKCVKLGFYDKELLDKYTKDEWKTLNSFIDHRRDFELRYCAMEQMRGKYLVKNRVTGQIYETPQMTYMLIAATLFAEYGKDRRMKFVKEFYDAISTHLISLPTPIMSGVRTPQRQFSSCILIDSGDSLDSISASASAIVKYVSQRAGIGINGGRIRALGSPIRQGDTSHTGVIPFYKHFASAVKSCSQGGVRSGAATLYYPIWHLEVEDLLVLKNNRGVEDTRIRHIDYAVQFNKVMYERLLSGGNITLFSPHDVPGMYDAFFTDVDKFRTIYEEAEANPNIRKKTVSAIDLFTAFMTERKETGRIYLMNVDHANSHGSFKPDLAPIYMSNLCLEVTEPTKPLNDFNDDGGEIAACNLAAINWGMISAPEDFFRPAELAIRALDALLDYQNYPVSAAARSTHRRRMLGVGIINLAYWLAKNDLSYQNITPEGLSLIHRYMEAQSYALIKASVELAKEKGPCEAWRDTKYSDGIFPIHTYKKELDEIVTPVYYMDWELLSREAKEYGIRNSCLMAGMPAETSAQISNSTNGIEPVRALITVKQSKDGILKQVVPEYRKLKNKYDLLWNQKSPEGYLKICAVLQKFMDQSLSTNTSYNPRWYNNEELSMSDLLGHMIMSYKYGIKTLYYFNTFDSSGEAEDLPSSQETCESCVI